MRTAICTVNTFILKGPKKGELQYVITTAYTLPATLSEILQKLVVWKIRSKDVLPLSSINSAYLAWIPTVLHALGDQYTLQRPAPDQAASLWRVPPIEHLPLWLDKDIIAHRELGPGRTSPVLQASGRIPFPPLVTSPFFLCTCGWAQLQGNQPFAQLWVKLRPATKWSFLSSSVLVAMHSPTMNSPVLHLRAQTQNNPSFLPLYL